VGAGVEPRRCADTRHGRGPGGAAPVRLRGGGSPGQPDLGPRRVPEEAPPFFRDTELTFRFRTFYWDQEAIDGTEPRALTIGGALVYESGQYKDVFSIGTALYFSEPRWAPKSGDATGLPRPGQEGYAVAGQGWARIRYANQSLQAYRQVVDLPYVNKADTRMTPNTSEAYMLRGNFPEVPRLGQVNYVIDRSAGSKESERSGSAPSTP
jgi:hypothetical protein